MKTRALLAKGVFTLGLAALVGLLTGVPAARAGAVDKTSLTAGSTGNW